MYPSFVLLLYFVSSFKSKFTRNCLVCKHTELTAIRLLYAWLLGWLLNDCPVFIRLVGIIKPVFVFAGIETEVISNLLMNSSVCLDISTWSNNIVSIANQKYLHFIICILIRKFIMPQLFNWSFSRFRYILTNIERMQAPLSVSSS